MAPLEMMRMTIIYKEQQHIELSIQSRFVIPYIAKYLDHCKWAIRMCVVLHLRQTLTWNTFFMNVTWNV